MVKNLSLKIGQVHHIAIDEADCADTGCGQIERRRRTKASCADQENLGLGNLFLSLATYLWQENVAAIPVYLIFSKFHLLIPLGVKREASREARRLIPLYRLTPYA